MTNSNHVVQSLSNTRFLGVCSWIDTSPHTFQIQWNVMLVIALWCNHMSLQIRQISSEDKRTPLSLSVVTNHFLFIKIFKSITMYVELRKSTKYPLIILTLSSFFRVSFLCIKKKKEVYIFCLLLHCSMRNIISKNLIFSCISIFSSYGDIRNRS